MRDRDANESIQSEPLTHYHLSDYPNARDIKGQLRSMC